MLSVRLKTVCAFINWLMGVLWQFSEVETVETTILKHNDIHMCVVVDFFRLWLLHYFSDFSIQYMAF